MPAIRYYPHGVCANVLTHMSSGRRHVFSGVAEVRKADGDFERLDWEGFICVHALPFMGEGRLCKIICTHVTDSDGVTNWREVERGGYALGWMRLGMRGKSLVHGIVGRDGYPITLSAGGSVSDPRIRDYIKSSREQKCAVTPGDTYRRVK